MNHGDGEEGNNREDQDKDKHKGDKEEDDEENDDEEEDEETMAKSLLEQNDAKTIDDGLALLVRRNLDLPFMNVYRDIVNQHADNPHLNNIKPPDEEVLQGTPHPVRFRRSTYEQTVSGQTASVAQRKELSSVSALSKKLYYCLGNGGWVGVETNRCTVSEKSRARSATHPITSSIKSSSAVSHVCKSLLAASPILKSALPECLIVPGGAATTKDEQVTNGPVKDNPNTIKFIVFLEYEGEDFRRALPVALSLAGGSLPCKAKWSGRAAPGLHWQWSAPHTNLQEAFKGCPVLCLGDVSVLFGDRLQATAAVGGDAEAHPFISRIFHDICFVKAKLTPGDIIPPVSLLHLAEVCRTLKTLTTAFEGRRITVYDVEAVVLIPPHTTIPWEITVQGPTSGAPVVSATLDYKFTAVEAVEAIEAAEKKPLPPRRRRYLLAALRRFYGDDETRTFQGTPVREFKRQLVDKLSLHDGNTVVVCGKTSTEGLARARRSDHQEGNFGSNRVRQGQPRKVTLPHHEPPLFSTRAGVCVDG
ncbi:hypothetical protein BU23DRAFT_571699 [Bimuria novae-zelandiae CBS 107.79]|uniref:Uncharacterized protein n=1 Tax=Bimuria novae-zelandiae CBS 107.79 TaxID=1447943 RepID=A0A6A5UY33_9PLEO|nr:hypothetical protein BU23DRAFT_571699 [Bimuria novae-zelandiae CBS 107.79]